MALLLKYLVPKDGLPDPKGSLSQSILSRAIAAANDERSALRKFSAMKLTHEIFLTRKCPDLRYMY